MVMTVLPVAGNLTQRRFFLWFTDAADEASYMTERWRANRRRARIAAFALAAFCFAMTVDYNRTDYGNNPVLFAPLFSCRIAPILVLCVFPFHDGHWVARRWSGLSSFCVLLIALSIYLQPGKESPSWLPYTAISLLPQVLAFGLSAVWYDVLWSSLVSIGIFGGLILPGAAGVGTGTAAVLAVTSLVVAVHASYSQDVELRDAFRREIASYRRLTSVLSVNRVVEQQLSQRLYDILRRSNIVLTEVDRDGIVSWISPGCRSLLGVTAGDVLTKDTFRWVHPDDAGVLREAIAFCTAPDDQPSPKWRSCVVQFRRQRGSVEVWVSAEVHAVGRSTTASAPTDAIAQASARAALASASSGVQYSSVLLIESDLTDDRKRSAAAKGAASLTLKATVLPLISRLSVGSLVSGSEHSSTSSLVQRSNGTQASYDPFFERTLYTLLASMRASAVTIARNVASPRLSDGPAAGPLDQSADSVSIRALRSASACLTMAVHDSISVARLRSEHLPLRDDSEIVVRELVEDVVTLVHRRVAQDGADTAGSIRVTVDDRVPRLMTIDPVRFRALVELLLGAALDTSGWAGVDVALYLDVHHQLSQSQSGLSWVSPPLPGQVPQRQQQQQDANDGGNVLCFAVSFDAHRAGGVQAVTAALSADPLRADIGGPFSPVPLTEVHAAPSNVADIDTAALSFPVLLPLLLHMALCLGGVVDIYAAAPPAPLSTAGTATAASAAAERAVIVVKVPRKVGFRPTVPGPSAPESPAHVRPIIDAAPVHVVPFSLPSRYTVVQTSGAPLSVDPQQSAHRASPVAPQQQLQPSYARGAQSTVVLPGPSSHLSSQASVTTYASVPAPAPVPPVVVALPPSAHASGDHAAQAPDIAGRTRGMHVLLVDDESTNRRLGARLLARLDCTWDLLEDGDQVLAFLQEPGRRTIDAILLDIIMERSDGILVCRDLRAAGVDIPIIAVTGTAGAEDLPRFQAAGFDLVVSKPFNLQDIARALAVGRAIRGGGEGAEHAAGAPAAST